MSTSWCCGNQQRPCTELKQPQCNSYWNYISVYYNETWDEEGGRAITLVTVTTLVYHVTSMHTRKPPNDMVNVNYLVHHLQLDTEVMDHKNQVTMCTWVFIMHQMLNNSSPPIFHMENLSYSPRWKPAAMLAEFAFLLPDAPSQRLLPRTMRIYSVEYGIKEWSIKSTESKNELYKRTLT